MILKHHILLSAKTATFNDLLKILYSIKRQFAFSNPSESRSLVPPPPVISTYQFLNLQHSHKIALLSSMSQLMWPEMATVTYASSQFIDQQNFLIGKSPFCQKLTIWCLNNTLKKSSSSNISTLLPDFCFSKL